MKLQNPKIDIFANSDIVEINIHDSSSGITFCKIKLSASQFCAALGRLSYAPVEELELNGLDIVGKNLEISELVFPFNASNYKYSDRENEAIEQSKKHIPEGWVSDDYFRSQNSFFTKDGKDFARVTIRRWV